MDVAVGRHNSWRISDNTDAIYWQDCWDQWILNGAVENADRVWRIVFLIAMVLGGVFAVYVLGGHVPEQYSGSVVLVIVAGLLVGVGTRIGNGCTSGHGICG